MEWTLLDSNIRCLLLTLEVSAISDCKQTKLSQPEIQIKLSCKSLPQAYRKVYLKPIVYLKPNEHFLLHCPLYSILRQDLFDQLSDIDGFNVADVDPKELCPLLLFGDQNLGTVANRIILEATISFIKASVRLD